MRASLASQAWSTAAIGIKKGPISCLKLHVCLQQVTQASLVPGQGPWQQWQVTRASLVPGQSPWSLEHSLFQQRAKENEARDIFDTVEVRLALCFVTAVLDAQFEVDWQRICQKGGLEQAVAAATVNPAAHNGEAINRQPEVNLQLGQ
eukprot:scaffold138367_cov18-Tisochrysis_lutea.AAC.1